MPIEHPFIEQQPDEVGEAEPGEHYGSGLLAADVGVGWTESGRAGTRERGRAGARAAWLEVGWRCGSALRALGVAPWLEVSPARVAERGQSGGRAGARVGERAAECSYD